jgi:penicillin-binding protein 2
MRIKALRVFLGLSFLVLVIGLYRVQIIRGNLYWNLSEKNRIKIVPLFAPRGRIFDRQGRILADRQLSFDVVVMPREASGRKDEFADLAQILGVSLSKLEKMYKRNYIAPFVPVTVSEDVGKGRAIFLESQAEAFPGIEIAPRALRYYPYEENGSHVLGYLGEKADRGTPGRIKRYGWQPSTQRGLSGIEYLLDEDLRGKMGGLQVEVDNRSRIVRVLGFRRPQAGKDIYLTIDMELQELAEDVLGNIKGVIIVIEPTNGEILAMAISPRFNPNAFIRDELSQMRTEYLSSKDLPLFNRATQGQYPPGSIFKIIVAAAGLEEKIISSSSQMFCPGSYIIGQRKFRCWKSSGHGKQNLRDALAHSCNVFFYKLGLKLGRDKIVEYAGKFGLGDYTHVGLPGEASGFLPTRGRLKEVGGDRWYPGQTANLSIGQG